MQRAPQYLAMAFLISGVALCQPVPTPQFEIADVHPSAPSPRPNPQAGFLSGGRYEARGVTLADLIQAEWELDYDSMYGGPTWLESDRFDIIAKAPPSASVKDLGVMLRALLTDRFKLVLRNDKKPIPVYALTLGKGTPLLRKAAADVTPECKQTGTEPGPPGYVLYECVNMSTAAFAAQLRRLAFPYIDRPVADATGLTGAWDFSLKWSPRDKFVTLPPGGGAPILGLNIYDAIDKQLGLKLELQRLPMPVTVIESVSRIPTPNPPDVSKILPPAPTEFEVADVKPSQPGANGRKTQFLPGGRIDFRNQTLKQLIGIAWDLEDNRIAGGPKWLDSSRFDLIARAAVGAGNAYAPEDTMHLMLRALLIERFKLKTHEESQPLPVIQLLIGKRGPMFKEADASSRSHCRQSGSYTGTGAAVIVATLTCQNTTMAKFAETIGRAAPTYLDRPVVDLTGLKGSYDLSISWTPKALTQGNRSQLDDSPLLGAAIPSSGLTVFEAGERQLGLQFKEGQKYPLPVLVVDSAEPIQGDN